MESEKIMPLTPFHLGPALFFGLLLFAMLNLPTFLIANIILDIEPFLVIILNLDYPLHGFFHTFLGSSIIAILLALVMVKVDKKIQKTMKLVKLKQKHSPRSIWLASFLGVYLHILFDSPLYTDIKPFYPLDTNPFFKLIATSDVYNLCTVLFILGIVLYFSKTVKTKKK